MFRGIHAIALDAKGRLGVPVRYRPRLAEQCAGQLILTADPDRCLLMYPLPVWQQVEAQLIQLPVTHRRARGLKRLLLGHAEEVELDAQGRILVSAPLREYAGLERQVMLVGQGNKFEIWNDAAWREQRDAWLDAEEFDEGISGLDGVVF